MPIGHVEAYAAAILRCAETELQHVVDQLLIHVHCCRLHNLELFRLL